MIEGTIYFWALLFLPLVLFLELALCGISWLSGREPDSKKTGKSSQGERTIKHAA